jgi:glycosyltransferase involved in cell wall biosynthesis
MKIGLNLLHARRKMGGGWNYINNIIVLLQNYDKENQYFVYCTKESEGMIYNNSFNKCIIKIPLDNQILRVIYENTILQIRFYLDNIDIVHWFSNTQAVMSIKPGMVTIYDLLALKKDSPHNIVKNYYLRYIIRQTINKASLLAPISNSTRVDLLDHFNICKQRIVVVPYTLSYNLNKISKSLLTQFKNKYNLPSRYWLYVANCYPHKNHERLLYAYSKLRALDSNTWPLVLRGDKKNAAEYLTKLIFQLNIKNYVIWLPGLEEEEMPALYSSATALVFPSLFEGAGLPIVEAMFCGCPVVASDIPTTREFAADAAFMFDPLEVTEILDAMRMFQNDKDTRLLYKKRGLLRAKYYQPNVVFNKLIDGYRSIYRNSQDDLGVQQ